MFVQPAIQQDTPHGLDLDSRSRTKRYKDYEKPLVFIRIGGNHSMFCQSLTFEVTLPLTRRNDLFYQGEFNDTLHENY